jgi:hypothetical protein
MGEQLIREEKHLVRPKLIALTALALALLPVFVPALAVAAPLAQATPTVQATPEGGPNLLKNGDFEVDGDSWPMQDGIGEVQAALGWRAYFVDKPPKYVVRPDFCYYFDDTIAVPREKPKDDGCFWARPEYRPLKTGPDTKNRIHGGVQSQKYFSYGRMHEAGLMQRVTGITPGSQLRFSVFMEAWMCNDFVQACDGGRKSQNATTMHLKVGIDPTGGTDAFSSNVIWSGEGDSFDHWAEFSVEAAAVGDAVTVFTHSRPEWTDFARMNNDVYVDDASLIVVAAPQSSTPTPESAPAPAPVKAAAAAPAPCAQMRFVSDVTIPDDSPVAPDASFVKTWRVKNSGTCAWSGTLKFIGTGKQMGGKSPTELPQTNVGKETDVSLNLTAPTEPGTYQGTWEAYATDGTVLGRLVVQIKVVGEASAPTTTLPVDAAPTSVAVAPATTAAASAPAIGGLCVQAFNDRNASGTYDANEELVGNIKFTVLSGATEVISYTTNGIDEPHCFADVAPGRYVVRVDLPMNYKSTTDEQLGVTLTAGQTVNVSFGTQPPSDKSQVATSGSGKTTNVFTRFGGAMVGLGGLGVVLTMGVVGFVLLSRRQ